MRIRGSPAWQALAGFVALLAAAAVLGYVAGAQRSAAAQLAWGLAAAAVVVLGMALAVVVIRGVAGAMSGLTEAMRRFGGGELSARARRVTGPPDLRQLVQDFNAMAELVSGEVAQRDWARQVARGAGTRIRAHLRARDVINEARLVIEDELDADAAYLHLIDEHGKLGPPIGHEDDWIMPKDFLETMPPEVLALMRELFRSGDSMVLQDMAAPGYDSFPPQIMDPVRAAGIVSHLLVPFGGDSEMLGIVTAERLRHGHPWTRPEIEAVESIAADIGRGLHHAHLYEQETRLVEELKSVNDMRAEFFTTVAHELRSPLAGVEGYVELLSDGEAGPVTAAQQTMLEAIERGAARLRNLIEDLFTLAKLESGAESVMRQVELSGVITEATDVLRPSAAARALTLTSSCPPGLAVDGDAGQLDQALINLLSNAVKFTPEGGQVSVTASAEDGQAVVAVRDSGIGIADQDRGRLFSRFFRGSNAVEKRIPGTGLGLAIVQAIITSHDGEVAVQSQEGAGTTVTLRLPLAGPGQQPAGKK